MLSWTNRHCRAQKRLVSYEKSCHPLIIVSPNLQCGDHEIDLHMHMQAADIAHLPTLSPGATPMRSLSSVNTLFDILIKPPVDFGFSYRWRSLSSPALSDQTDLSIDGLAPCCIPVSPAARSQVFSLYNVTVSGRIMGTCNLDTGYAAFGWNHSVIGLSMANGSSSAQILVMDQSAATDPPAAQAPSQSGEPEISSNLV